MYLGFRLSSHAPRSNAKVSTQARVKERRHKRAVRESTRALDPAPPGGARRHSMPAPGPAKDIWNARVAAMAQTLQLLYCGFQNGRANLTNRYAGYRPHQLQKPELLKSRALR